MATTHTTSSPLPWNRNGVETGGPVRIGQVHTCMGLSHYLFVGAHGLWENSAAVQTRLGRARTVSRLQGYPVSRANEPRELPYVVEPIRAERIAQGLPVVNGRPSFSRPVSSALLPRAEKMVRSDPSLPPLPALPRNLKNYERCYSRIFFPGVFRTFLLFLFDLVNYLCARWK